MPMFQKVKYNKSKNSVTVTPKKDRFDDKKIVVGIHDRLQKFAPYIYDIVPVDEQQVETLVVHDVALSEREDDRIGVIFNCKAHYANSDEPLSFKTPTFYMADRGEQQLPAILETELRRLIEDVEDAVKAKRAQRELDFDEDNGRPGIGDFVPEAAHEPE